MKNKVLTIIIILLLTLTGVLLWYAFTQQSTEDETSDVFNEETTVENAEGMQFDTLSAPDSSEPTDVPESEVGESEVPDTISPDPTSAEPGPSFNPNQIPTAPAL